MSKLIKFVLIAVAAIVVVYVAGLLITVVFS